MCRASSLCGAPGLAQPTACWHACMMVGRQQDYLPLSCGPKAKVYLLPGFHGVVASEQGWWGRLSMQQRAEFTASGGKWVHGPAARAIACWVMEELASAMAPQPAPPPPHAGPSSSSTSTPTPTLPLSAQAWACFMGRGRGQCWNLHKGIIREAKPGWWTSNYVRLPLGTGAGDRQQGEYAHRLALWLRQAWPHAHGSHGSQAQQQQEEGRDLTQAQHSQGPHSSRPCRLPQQCVNPWHLQWGRHQLNRQEALTRARRGRPK